MCLVVQKDTKFKVAEKDITVYKILKRTKITDSGSYWFTPYCASCVGKRINKDTEFKANGLAVKRPNAGNSNISLIEEGVIHVYSRQEACFCLLPFGNLFVFECVIPKGTEYIIGENYEIGAKEIRFVKRLKQLK